MRGAEGAMEWAAAATHIGYIVCSIPNRGIGFDGRVKMIRLQIDAIVIKIGNFIEIGDEVMLVEGAGLHALPSHPLGGGIAVILLVFRRHQLRQGQLPFSETKRVKSLWTIRKHFAIHGCGEVATANPECLRENLLRNIRQAQKIFIPGDEQGGKTYQIRLKTRLLHRGQHSFKPVMKGSGVRIIPSLVYFRVEIDYLDFSIAFFLQPCADGQHAKRDVGNQHAISLAVRVSPILAIGGWIDKSLKGNVRRDNQ
ncbi:hypothetical protein Cv017_11610 [Chromobacterium subtsugae]|nr:hypothetical protein Cv017_11610 [Chromobacterium subtsugae]